MNLTSKVFKKFRCVLYDLVIKNFGQQLNFDFGGLAFDFLKEIIQRGLFIEYKQGSEVALLRFTLGRKIQPCSSTLGPVDVRVGALKQFESTAKFRGISEPLYRSALCLH